MLPGHLIYLVILVYVRRVWRGDNLGYQPLYPMSYVVSLMTIDTTCHVSRVTECTCVGDGMPRSCMQRVEKLISSNTNLTKPGFFISSSSVVNKSVLNMSQIKTNNIKDFQLLGGATD